MTLHQAEWVAAELIAVTAAAIVLVRARQAYMREQRRGTSPDDQGRSGTTEYSSTHDD